ncbi:MAG TPA: methyltransferase domain-containing protein [Actinomycetota bacterium]|nr:methyltransferase domain-containing protein [Actinomycetota bacterium]
MSSPNRDELARRNETVRRSWAKQASFYDKSIGFFERRLVGTSHRPWACSRASGDVLEIAIGTGLNLEYYANEVRITGIDLTPEMLAIARERVRDLGREVDLREGDAHRLELADASFDSVVCTYSLCNIPDPQRAISEMRRVLRPGGKLILVDHIRSTSRPVFWIQRFIEIFSIRLGGEHMTRRPLEYVEATGFEILERERLGFAGIVERLAALKPR